jgi:thiamine pyrophosphate-dependent acetolactate synthase large subunit-like protein
MSTQTLDRRAAVAELLAQRGEALLVTGLGSPTWDAAAAGDDVRNFYLWGGMGGTVMVGLGLALAQPSRRVIVLTGDGDMLMGMGSLATVGVQQPKNLAVIVLDNERYGETGMQDTHTRAGVDLAGVALASRFRAAATVSTAEDWKAWIPRLCGEPGPLFVDLKISAEKAPMTLPLRDGTHIKNRFREALLGKSAFG